MPIAIQMPALSPTMESGKLARWLVKVGDTVSSGDILAEIETDKATMEFEAVDEGTIVAIDIPEGTEDVKVGTVIAQLVGEDEDAAPPPKPAAAVPAPKAAPAGPVPTAPAAPAPMAADTGDRIVATPLAKRIAAQNGIDLKAVAGSGPNGRIVKADVDGAGRGAVVALTTAAAPVAAPTPAAAAAPAPPAALPDFGIPHEDIKLTSMRKTIARRLSESKQQVPHIYLTVDVRLDALLKLRG
jgi:pyruvate dehydrogenase E2 component (dihydrolipoamide acetyltransferase)